MSAHTAARPRTATGRSLRDLVARLEPGARLPGERELSVRLGVARMTLRRAVDGMVADGLVERRHGSGTYVCPRPVTRTLGLTSFSEDMRQRGLSPHSRLLSMEQAGATAAVAEYLRVDPGTPVLRFERLRCGSGLPFAVETVWMPARYVPGLGAEDLEGSLYELLGRRYGIVTATAQVTLEPVLPDPRSAELLEIGPTQPCLKIRMVDQDAARRTIMFADCIYRGDRYSVAAQVTRSDLAPPRRSGSRG